MSFRSESRLVIVVLSSLHLAVQTSPLEQAPDAYARLRRGEIQGRAVMVPGR